ncbi:hypothetical protein [Vibrio crassostreae]|uniref:hypothetical protein n=1 Tax=Vibrio crassostreae TaxID=246167 RepID=UPI001B317733|nr:hypothetical protein [Vibrio crassostreae]
MSNSLLKQAKERTAQRKELHITTLHNKVACRNEAIAVFQELAQISQEIAPQLDVKQAGSLNKRSAAKLDEAVAAIKLPEFCSVDAYSKEGKLHITVTHHYQKERLEIKNHTVESVTQTIKFNDYVWDFYEGKACALIETNCYTVDDILEAETSIVTIEDQIRELQGKLTTAQRIVQC